MKVLAFGIVKEIMGGSSVSVETGEGLTVEALRARMEEQYPKLKQLSSFMIAVNGEYAKPGTVIDNGDELAIIPPVSGG